MKNTYLILKSHLITPRYWIKNVLWRFPQTISKKEVIFVLGTPRSGTTLLQKILESHSKLFSIQAETAIFSFKNFWSKNRKHFDFDELTKNKLLSESKDNIDFFENSVSILMDRNPGKIFIEKTPQHIRYLSFLIKHFPNAKFVHIVRDGRDCYCSAIKHPWIPQSRSIELFSKYYSSCVKRGIKSIGHPNVHTLKYEDLVQDPLAIVKDLMTFLSLEVEEEQLNSSFRSKDKRAQLEQFKKLNEGINNSSVGRWKNELNKKQIQEFEKYSKDVLRYFGYD